MNEFDKLKKEKTEEAKNFFKELEISDKNYSLKDYQSFVENMNKDNCNCETRITQTTKI